MLSDVPLEVPGGLGSVVAVACRDRCSLALRDDGSLIEWGACDGRPIFFWPSSWENVRKVSRNNGPWLRGDGTIVDAIPMSVPPTLRNLVAVGGSFPLLHMLAAAVDAPLPPLATTRPASRVSATTVDLNGLVSDRGEDTAVWFQWGETTDYTQTTPATTTSGTGDNLFLTAPLARLEPNTTYHFQLVARSRGGSAAGGDLMFTTLPQSQRPGFRWRHLLANGACDSILPAHLPRVIEFGCPRTWWIGV